MQRRYAVKQILVTLAAVVLCFTAAGFAQEPAQDETLSLAPLTVTAEKKTQDAQDVASSLTAFSDTDIQDAGITTIQDLSNVVPNLYIANWGIRGTSYVFIRGIGAINNEPAVGFYIDDVGYMDSRAFDTNLFDIERIEVLRGPQGTLYGRNSLAGVVNIVTQKPDNETVAGMTYTAGNYSLHQGSVYLRTPVADDRLFLGLSAGMESRDGYTDNTYLGEDVDDHDALNGRLNLRWTPSEKLDVSLMVDGEHMDDGAFPLGNLYSLRENPHDIAYDYKGDYERDVFGTSLRAACDTSWGRITSITAFRTFEDSASNDQDFTVYPLYTARETIDDDQFTQEIRLASPDDGRDLEWLVGLYGFNKEKDHFLNLNYAAGVVLPDAAVDQDADSDLSVHGGALFGQATYTLFEKLGLSAGLRYDYEKSEIDHLTTLSSGGSVFSSTAVDDSEENDAWLPKVQMTYHYTPDLMTYAGVSRGYRSGGFNTAYGDASDIKFESEFTWNYEMGCKSSWFNNRLHVNTSIFFIEIKDQQIVQLLPSADTMIKNAGKSQSTGFEIETKARLYKGLTLEAGFGYADSEFKDHQDTLAGTDYKGNKTPMAPEYTYNLALQYNKAVSDRWDIFFRTELNGIGSFYWDDANTLKQDAYQLVNMSLGLESEKVDIVLWARNLFDEAYESVAFEFPGSDPIGQSGDPLTMGITVRFRFL